MFLEKSKMLCVTFITTMFFMGCTETAGSTGNWTVETYEDPMSGEISLEAVHLPSEDKSKMISMTFNHGNISQLIIFWDDMIGETEVRFDDGEITELDLKSTASSGVYVLDGDREDHEIWIKNFIEHDSLIINSLTWKNHGKFDLSGFYNAIEPHLQEIGLEYLAH